MARRRGRGKPCAGGGCRDRRQVQLPDAGLFKIGLIPDAGGSYILPRAMGMAKAMGASLFAEKIMAEDAANSGMIWEAVEDEQFETTWRARPHI